MKKRGKDKRSKEERMKGEILKKRRSGQQLLSRKGSWEKKRKWRKSKTEKLLAKLNWTAPRPSQQTQPWTEPRLWTRARLEYLLTTWPLPGMSCLLSQARLKIIMDWMTWSLTRTLMTKTAPGSKSPSGPKGPSWELLYWSSVTWAQIWTRSSSPLKCQTCQLCLTIRGRGFSRGQAVPAGRLLQRVSSIARGGRWIFFRIWKLVDSSMYIHVKTEQITRFFILYN